MLVVGTMYVEPVQSIALKCERAENILDLPDVSLMAANAPRGATPPENIDRAPSDFPTRELFRAAPLGDKDDCRKRPP